MKILGIVAEYDPFHNGHLRHLSEAAKLIAPDLTFIALSSCVKQRGELSLLSPADRALCALKSGADAVFSLPALWTVRDAEHYALGAVSLLSRLGVTHLAFGAETADPALLRQAADILESPGSGFRTVLKQLLASGSGYPAALSSALSAVLPEAAGLLDHPNNVLAVCYFRAVLRLNLSLEPVVIPRSGSYHATEIDPSAPSASAIRESLNRGVYDPAFQAVPVCTAGILRRRFLEDRVPDSRIFDAMLLSRLRSMGPAEFSRLPDLSEGMENALRTAAAAVSTRNELLSVLAGKRYPAARISRLCACALLGISQCDIQAAPLPESALLLALRKQPSMTALWKKASIPVISSFSAWKKEAHPADLAVWRLWAQCCRLPDTLPFSEKLISL